MKISFSTLACPEWNLKMIIEKAKEYGYDGIEIRGIKKELDLSKVPEMNEKSDETKRILEKFGIEIACISSSAVFSSPDSKERERNVNLTISHLEIAKRFYCNVVRVFIGRIPEGISLDECVKYVVDELKKVEEYSKKIGVKVGIETHDDFSTGERLNLLFKHLNPENIGCVWDVYNSLHAGEDIERTFEFIKNRIFFTQVKDGDLKGNYTLLGRGKLPLKDLVSLLKKIGYDGYLSFEYEKRWKPDLLPPEEALPDGAKVLREAIK